MKRKAPGVVSASLAKRGARIAAQDREWSAALPSGWFSTSEAGLAWGLSRNTASNRLALLRVSGIVRHSGSGLHGRWNVRKRL